MTKHTAKRIPGKGHNYRGMLISHQPKGWYVGPLSSADSRSSTYCSSFADAKATIDRMTLGWAT